MKKLTTLILMVVICGAVWGQEKHTVKKIEILKQDGTNGGDPTSIFRADVQNDVAYLKIKMGDEETSKFDIGYNHHSDGAWYSNFSVSGYGTGFFRGNVGIGTTEPSAKLEVAGTIKADELHVFNYVFLNSESASASKNKVNSSALLFRSSGYAERPRYQYWRVLSEANNTWGAGDLVFESNTDGMGYNERVRFCSNGRIGIGTTTPSAKLDVTGNIKAHEIAVTLASIDDMQLNGTLAANNITYTANGNTADFVFEDNYHLKDLTEVEAFIKTNKHLPEIPSATEMEEAGVNLAEMNKLLLMKVEELTLYAIEQKAEAEKNEAEVERLKAEVEEVRGTESKVRREMEKMTEDRRQETEEMKGELNKQNERLAKMESLLEELMKQ